MSINDDVLDDLSNNANDNDDFIKTPDSATKDAQPVTIVAKTPEVKEDETELTDGQKANLPNLDVSFKTVNDGINKVTELKDVEGEILASECINKHNAKLVDDVFGNFLGTGIILEEFTQLPSKTNLLYTTNFMRRNISIEEQATIANYQLLIDQPLNDAKELLNNLKNSYITNIVIAINEVQSISIDLSQDVIKNKNLVVQYKGGFVNLGTIDITSIETSEITIDGLDTDLLFNIINGIKNVLKSPLMERFIITCIENQPIEPIILDCANIGYDATISIMDLSNFFSNPNVVDNIYNVEKLVLANIETIERIQKESDKFKQDYESIRKYILSNSTELQTMISSIQKLSCIVNGLNYLALHSKALFELVLKL